MARALMIQGTGSNVGKSLLVAGLCRAATQRGLTVRPFKPQNMSNNAAVTDDGGEIGRAQAVQAWACKTPLSVHMNPVLLKPESETGAQVVVQGQRMTTTKAREYGRLKPQLMAAVLDSFARLKAEADLVLVEGAGSPAEINLRPRDIANMGFAVAADVPVVLAGDIDRGGVIAQIVGTQAVLDTPDKAQIAGFLVNRFRGDPSLFDDGYSYIKAKTNWPGFGVLPWFADAWKLPAEDALDLAKAPRTSGVKIACLVFARISNFDDLDPLAQEPDVDLQMIEAGRPVPGDIDVVILPGSKSTRSDLAFMRAQGWDVDLAAHIRRGGHVLGICGGYQMLGHSIDDLAGIEGVPGRSDGLGLLDVVTTMTPHKRLTLVRAVSGAGTLYRGYEMHIGQTTGPDCARPVAHIDGRPEGAASATGQIKGTYLHGMFRDDVFRAEWLAQFGAASQGGYGAEVDAVLSALADHMETHLDLDALLAAAR